jgi:flagellar biogenesis protein FliO
MSEMRSGIFIASLLMCLGASALAQDIRLHQPGSFVAPSNATELASGDAQEPQPSQPLRLAPRGQQSERDLAQPRKSVSSSSTMTTVLGALGVVLGLFFCLAWLFKRNMPQALTRLPNEVVEQLGRAPLGGKQNLHLLRVGGKLVLVAVTPFGAETLTEITHPDEVERLVALCKAHSAHGPSAEFRAVLQQFEREPAGPGFLGHTERSDAELASTPQRGRPRGGLHA